MSGTSELATARHIHLYGFTWLGFFVLLGLMPVKYGSLEAFQALFGMLLWVLLSLLVAYATHLLLKARRRPEPRSFFLGGVPLRVPDLERLVWTAIAFATVGFVCLCYDRLALQGIDFSKGIAVARHLWRRAGEEREGVSSIFSVLGYLLGFSFFVATTVGHLHWEHLRPLTRRGIIVSATLLVALNSLLTGGRSIVLIQLACVVATGGLRGMLGKKMMPGRGARIWIGGTLVMIVAIGYSLYVFSARADAGKIPPEVYVTGMLGYLGGQPTQAFYNLNVLPASVAATAQFGTVAGAYLTHSYGTFESVLELQQTPGSVSFGFVRELLAKLGVGEQSSELWSLSGRFLSVPGSLWYDFGWWGFYFGAVVIGLLFGITPYLLRIRGGGGLSLVAVLVILITGLMAPLVLSIDILSVPFLILGFVLVDLSNRIFRGPKNWLYVSRPVVPGTLSSPR